MSNDDHGRESDTAIAEAFRTAGYHVTSAQVLPDNPRAISRARQLCIHAPGFRRPPAINLGSGYSAELDLHGCSEDQAYEKLEQFIKQCARKGCRKVLVITGEGSGKLKRLVPLWLEARPFKEFVADSCVADPWDGGNGARYVLLRGC